MGCTMQEPTDDYPGPGLLPVRRPARWLAAASRRDNRPLLPPSHPCEVPLAAQDVTETPAGTRPRVILHIGEPKTGTTSLQQIMWRNRSELAAGGVVLPGHHPQDDFRARTCAACRSWPAIPR